MRVKDMMGMGPWALSLCLLVPPTPLAAQQRREVDLGEGWLFSRDSTAWRQVSVPHDWAIDGPFDRAIDMLVTTSGDGRRMESTGRTGSLPWTGKGHYATTVDLDDVPGCALLVFDGAMSRPVVRINGREAGRWGCGYNAFRIDATEFLKEGENVIEVTLENMENSSRWYPGGGLFRPVRLQLMPATHIDEWGGWFRTLEAGPSRAMLDIATKVDGPGATEDLVACVTLLDRDGREAGSKRAGVGPDGMARVAMTVEGPNLWSPEEPYLYTLDTRVLLCGETLDRTTRRVGIRTVKVDAENGFTLNGVPRKIKGVCLHHDLGPLGAAANRAATERQLRLMKEMGCDAIRTSHNMPSTMQVEACDSMGLMVMAESFDAWTVPKCANDYSTLFDEWADRDIANLVLHFRNNPSIVMWSIGNEIPEQGSETGLEITRRLQGLCHELDPTRPVTQGLDRPDDAIASGVAQAMDVPGYNYRTHRYEGTFGKLPQGFLLGSETCSTVSSRGAYGLPVVVGQGITRPDGQCSAYDTECCPWSNLPDDDFRAQDDLPWMIGQFVWTGFDYLGEPTPYEERWPSRSSYFGICDLAGLPKDRYWLYRSQWRKDSPTLHLLPHWTWPGREGEAIPVYCYTSYPEAELFLNGRSLGRKSFDGESRLDRYRLRWEDVAYEPGEIRVVAYDARGDKAAEESVRTAGCPARMELAADRGSISGHGHDLSFVTITMKDADGNTCPTACDDVTFRVEGAGTFRGACNGDATSLVTFTSRSMPLFNGHLVVVVEGTGKGTATLTATAEGLPPASVDISVE